MIPCARRATMNQMLSIQQPQARLALTHGRIILPQQIVTGQALVVEGGQILGLAEVDALGSGTERLDLGDRYLAPGLIDLHTHGALGHTFNEPIAAAFTAITQEQARRGVTGLLATTVTAPIPNLVDCLEFSRHWQATTPEAAAQLLGVHVEGPFFCLSQRGAQDPAFIRTPDDGTVEALLGYHDVIRMMSYAPELPGALALTRRLVE